MSTITPRSGFHRPLHSMCLLVCLLLSQLTAGCSNEPELLEGFAPAFGTVTLDGVAVKDAQVVFSTEKGFSYGRTDEKGYYEAARSRSTTGAGLGPATVTVTTTAVFPDMSEEGLVMDETSGDFVRPETIPEHYREGIEIEITADGAPYNFDLTSTPPAS